MQVQMIKHLKTRTIHSNIYINLIVSFAIFFTCAYAFLMLIASKNVLIFIFNEQHQTQRSWVCGCELGIDVKCSVKYWIFTCPAKEATHDVFCLKYIQDVMTCKCFRIILVSFCLLIGLRMGGLNSVEVVCLPPTTTMCSFTFCFHNACIRRGMLH